MGRSRRQAVRSALAPGIAALALLAWSATGAQAQEFDPNALAAADQSLIQQMLEGERSHISRSLPVSQSVFTIIRTEMQPRICRFFVVQEQAGNQQQGVGCRAGAGQWQLAATMGEIAGAPVPTAPTVTAEATPAPAVTVIRPSQPQEDEPAILSSDPSTWPRIPLPDHRPARGAEVQLANTEEEITPESTAENEADNTAESAREDAQEVRATPAALAAIPLPRPRPAPPGVEQPVVVNPTIEPADRDANSAAPDAGDTLIATDGIRQTDGPDIPVIAQGDTDLLAEPDDFEDAAPLAVGEPPDDGRPAPITPPVPSPRP